MLWELVLKNKNKDVVLRYNIKKWASAERSTTSLKARLEYQTLISQKSLISDIRRLRRALNFTQTALAQSVGISQPVLTRIETGVSNPLLSTVLLLLAAMNRKLAIVPLDYDSSQPADTDDHEYN